MILFRVYSLSKIKTRREKETNVTKSPLPTGFSGIEKSEFDLKIFYTKINNY